MKRVDQQRLDYALRRMGLAIDRLLENESREEKAQAVRWLAAWKAVHSGRTCLRPAAEKRPFTLR